MEDRGAAAARGATATPSSPIVPAEPEILVGGRPLEWWGARLETLRRTPDDRALYELTRVRASAVGLAVEEKDGKFVVRASPELRAELLGGDR